MNVVMKKYIIIFAITACQKRVNKQDDLLEYAPPTCEENILFCDDEDQFDDLPEDNDDLDTGE
jgi:hypothetical protein